MLTFGVGVNTVGIESNLILAMFTQTYSSIKLIKKDTNKLNAIVDSTVVSDSILTQLTIHTNYDKVCKWWRC